MKDFLAMVAEKTGIKHFRAVKARFKDDLYKQFISTSTIPRMKENNKVMINLLNGTFVCEDGKYEFREFQSEDLLTYQLPFEYDPKAEAPMFQKFLNEVMPELFLYKEKLGVDFNLLLKMVKHLNRDNLKNIKFIAENFDSKELRNAQGKFDFEKFSALLNKDNN